MMSESAPAAAAAQAQAAAASFLQGLSLQITCSPATHAELQRWRKEYSVVCECSQGLLFSAARLPGYPDYASAMLMLYIPPGSHRPCKLFRMACSPSAIDACPPEAGLHTFGSLSTLRSLELSMMMRRGPQPAAT